MTPRAATPLESPSGDKREELAKVIAVQMWPGEWVGTGWGGTPPGFRNRCLDAASDVLTWIEGRAPSSPLIAPERGNSDATGARDTTGTGTQAVSSSPLVGELREALEEARAALEICDHPSGQGDALSIMRRGKPIKYWIDSALARLEQERGRGEGPHE